MLRPGDMSTRRGGGDNNSICTPHGIYRKKYRLRALFQSFVFVALLGGYHVYNNIINNNGVHSSSDYSNNNHMTNIRTPYGIYQEERLPDDPLNFGDTTTTTKQGDDHIKRRLSMVTEDMMNDRSDLSSSSAAGTVESVEQEGMMGGSTWDMSGKQTQQQQRRHQEQHEESQSRRRKLAADVNCDDIETIKPAWMSVFYAIGVLYMFVAIAIVCDDFFVPALEEIASPHHMNLDNDVAGATLMAAGGSAPELFTNLFGTFTESNIGFGTIIGSATFNVLLVIAMCSICAKEVLDLTWWPLFRDCTYYAVGLIVLALFVGVSSPNEIEVWEAAVLFVMYIGYVLIMWKNRDLHRSITGKELVDPEENNEDTSAGDEESGNLEMVKEQFDKLDEGRTGSITEVQLRELLAIISLTQGQSDYNIEDALSEIRHGQETAATSWEDFADWYRGSIFFEGKKKKSGEDDDEDENEPLWAPLMIPDEAGAFGILWHFIKLPIVAALTLTVPNMERPGMDKWCYPAFILSILWIGVFAWFMVEWTEWIGNTIGVPHVVMGYTVLAAGTSVPDLLSSVIVTRQGEGDMAISSSIGSNIFDITVGLPIPWLIYLAFPKNPKTIYIDSSNIWVSICVFLAMLVLVVLAIHCQGWKLTKTLGGFMFMLYIVFIIQAIALELPFKSCVSV